MTLAVHFIDPFEIVAEHSLTICSFLGKILLPVLILEREEIVSQRNGQAEREQEKEDRAHNASKTLT